MFTYVNPQPDSPKLEELLEDYWDLMPKYQVSFLICSPVYWIVNSFLKGCILVVLDLLFSLAVICFSPIQQHHTSRHVKFVMFAITGSCRQASWFIMESFYLTSSNCIIKQVEGSLAGASITQKLYALLAILTNYLHSLTQPIDPLPSCQARSSSSQLATFLNIT